MSGVLGIIANRFGQKKEICKLGVYLESRRCSMCEDVQCGTSLGANGAIGFSYSISQ